MADDNLKDPVKVRAISINASTLPIGLTPAYQSYILSQALDFTSVAGKANEAGKGAYDAQVKNDQQDLTLASHDTRITQNTNGIAALTIRVVNAETSITAIQNDYVSKTATGNQTVQPVSGSLLVGAVATPTTDKLQVAGSVNASVSYKVSGLQVVGARKTGWTAATGTAYRGTFDANQAWTIGVLNVLQIQDIANALTQARQRIKALEDDLRSHGLIN